MHKVKYMQYNIYYAYYITHISVVPREQGGNINTILHKLKYVHAEYKNMYILHISVVMREQGHNINTQ